MQFTVLYVVLWTKINHSPNYKQWKMANNPVSWRSLKIGATKKNFTYMKAHTFTDTRILSIHGTKSYCRAFVCVAAGVVSKYFLFLCLLNALFQITQVSNASRKSLISVWLKVPIPKMSCDNLSGEEMYSIHWICPMYVRTSWDMYPCASLASTNDFNYSNGFTHSLWWISAYFFIGLKVVYTFLPRTLLEIMSLHVFF
jgi:hypothetical protein